MTLAEILEEIRALEESEEFEGPKISSALTKEIQGRLKGFRRDPEIWEDHVVGEIVRAVKARRNPENHLDDWMIDIEDGGDGQFVVYIKDRLGHKIAVGEGPIALAVAMAYRALWPTSTPRRSQAMSKGLLHRPPDLLQQPRIIPLNPLDDPARRRGADREPGHGARQKLHRRRDLWIPDADHLFLGSHRLP